MNTKTHSVLQSGCICIWLLIFGLADTNAEDHYFLSKGIKMRYVVEGKGPPVVLIHGLTLDIESQWVETGITKALAQDYRVIAIDCRGHGKSDKPHEPAAYGIEMVEDVCRLLDHLNIKKAHIVGYSMGGSIALKLLATHSERCLTVILGDHAVYHEDYDFSDADKRAQKFAMASAPADIMPRPPPEAPAEGVRRWEAWVGMPHDFKAYAAVSQTVRDFKVTNAELRANGVAVLGLFCKADSQSEYLTTHLSNLKMVLIGGSHLNGFRRPEFISNLKDFLNAQRDQGKRTP